MDDELRNKCIELYGEKFGSWYDRIQEGHSVGTISTTVNTINTINKIEQAKRVVEAERTNKWIKIIRSYLLTTTN